MSGGATLVLESMILYSLAVRYGKWQRRSMIDDTPGPLDYCVEKGLEREPPKRCAVGWREPDEKRLP